MSYDREAVRDDRLGDEDMAVEKIIGVIAATIIGLVAIIAFPDTEADSGMGDHTVAVHEYVQAE
ncbi:hypothetical protein ACIP5Y_23475 [Nocardia sp. NPDC088792]|uniref:hypothetical protein n=1 Tax=Nocardia sp. NPDC088792 TaxID=3364332 RepID=UPI003819AE56